MLLIAFILCTVSTQLGSLSVNVQIVSILLAKNINDTKIFSLCVCELAIVVCHFLAYQNLCSPGLLALVVMVRIKFLTQ